MNLSSFLKIYSGDGLLNTTPLKGGGNNRVYLLEFYSGKKFVLKKYFQHPEDKRPRLKSEFSFLSFAWENGIRSIPEPVFANREDNFAVYSYIEGRLASTEDVSSYTVDQAMDFFLALNQKKDQGSHLALASEACLSIYDFFEAIDKRLSKLLSHTDKEVLEFVNFSLKPAWESLREETLRQMSAMNIGLYDRRLQEDLCITPSDFGFHNTLISKDRLFFIDFEYAGWDDPVKTACDFLCQPKIPISSQYFELIIYKIASMARNPEDCLKRIQLLFPVCRIKWCCILLNGFLGAGKARRNFAGVHEEDQLKKTRNYLEETLCSLATVKNEVIWHI